MKWILFTLLFLGVFQSGAFAQLDSILFSKALQTFRYDVEYLGDQNDDGYDDFMLVTYYNDYNRGYVFYGGDPMDTIPDVTLLLGHFHKLNAVDINADGYLDILAVNTEDDFYYDPSYRTYIDVYNGGPGLDAVVDRRIYPPDYNRHYGIYEPRQHFGREVMPLKNFKGDGSTTLAIYSDLYTDSTGSLPWGKWYFYNMDPVLRDEPFDSICGNPQANIRLEDYCFSYGDINGDGMTDFTLNFVIPIDPYWEFGRYFYYGNPSGSLTPVRTYLSTNQNPRYSEMTIVKDMNDDGYDDILVSDKIFPNGYPYWFHNMLIFGSSDFDTIPDFGFNTQNGLIKAWYNSINSADLNGDGYYDLMVSMGNSDARLWLGGRTMQELPAKRFYGGFLFGNLIGKVGDVNGDGVEDILIGEVPETSEPHFGRCYVFAGDTSLIGDGTHADLDDAPEIIAENLIISPAFPNPFNNTTVIEYTLQTDMELQIAVYDLLGREIVRVFEGQERAGTKRITLPPVFSSYGSGIYFVRFFSKEPNGVTGMNTISITYIK